MRTLFLSLGITLFLSTIPGAFADTIVAVNGSGGTLSSQPLYYYPGLAPNYTPTVLALSWTQNSAFQNVAVSATLFDFDSNCGSGSCSYGGYVNYTLVNAIGPGTSYTANGIARGSTFVNDSIQSWRLFTLNFLNPGTYYLVLDSSNQASAIYQFQGTTTVTKAPGVTFNGTLWSNDGARDTSYTAASTFSGDNEPIEFSVTGDPVASVPEPATFPILVVGLVLLGLVARRRSLFGA